jgi:hypothetical protein
MLGTPIRFTIAPYRAYSSYQNLKFGVLNVLDQLGEKYTITFT